MDYGLVSAAVAWGVIFYWGANLKKQTLIERARHSRRDEDVLGIIGPLAAEFVRGIATEEEIQKQLNVWAMGGGIAAEAAGEWRSMTTDERRILGQRAREAYDDPAFQAKMAPLYAAAHASLAKARAEHELAKAGLRPKTMQGIPPGNPKAPE